MFILTYIKCSLGKIQISSKDMWPITPKVKYDIKVELEQNMRNKTWKTKYVNMKEQTQYTFNICWVNEWMNRCGKLTT